LIHQVFQAEASGQLPGLGSVKDPLSIPAHRPIKSIYIKRFVALFDQIQE
jgi:hypothetical protein